MNICTEKEKRVKISPEHRYSDDFEPYKSADMKVRICLYDCAVFISGIMLHLSRQNDRNY